jgi:hypothetical protein
MASSDERNNEDSGSIKRLGISLRAERISVS